MSLSKSQYYDKPEGEDYVGKMVASNKIAASAAFGFAAVDVLMYTHPKGYVPTLARFAWWLGPAIGMASAFTTGTYAAARLRGVDDKKNYCVGACAAAGVAGIWQRNAVFGFSMCLFFSIAGCLKKLSKEEGWEFFPEPKYHVWSGVSPKRYDFTLTAEGEKGWTTGKE